MASPIVVLDRVTRIYGRFAALRDISLQLEAGSSTMLIGENGAGKSTLLRLIAGLGSPTYGSVSVFGQSPLDTRHRLAYMSHAPMLYEDLTALENLRYFASLSPQGGADPIAALRSVGLDPALTRRLSEYSQGMRQRASLARALMFSPELLLLDEPFSNLDAAAAEAMIDMLQQFVGKSSSGDRAPRTLLFTTHQRELAAPLAGSVLTLKQGQLIA